MKNKYFSLVLLTLLLSACSTVAPTTALSGTWIRTDMNVQRAASADQPILASPFIVLGTQLIINEATSSLTENTTNNFSLSGAQADLWHCPFTGAYTALVTITPINETSGTITWTAGTAENLPLNMTIAWQNICNFGDPENGIPTEYEDHAPLLSAPNLTLNYQLLDDRTLELSTLFNITEGDNTILIERSYTYIKE